MFVITRELCSLERLLEGGVLPACILDKTVANRPSESDAARQFPTFIARSTTSSL